MAAKMDDARITAVKTVDVAPETEHVILEPIVPVDEPFSIGPWPPVRRVLKQWEYKMVSAFAPNVILGLLNEAGAEGWDTISVDTYHGVAWLKRLVR